jgi:DNA-binding response OmpR family regulator
MPTYTETQKRILQVLSDGLRHKRQELVDCLDDPLANPNTISVHLTYLRRKLNPIGEDVICVKSAKGYHYQHVRLLRKPDE